MTTDKELLQRALDKEEMAKKLYGEAEEIKLELFNRLGVGKFEQIEIKKTNWAIKYVKDTPITFIEFKISK